MNFWLCIDGIFNGIFNANIAFAYIFDQFCNALYFIAQLLQINIFDILKGYNPYNALPVC